MPPLFVSSAFHHLSCFLPSVPFFIFPSLFSNDSTWGKGPPVDHVWNQQTAVCTLSPVAFNYSVTSPIYISPSSLCPFHLSLPSPPLPPRHFFTQRLHVCLSGFIQSRYSPSQSSPPRAASIPSWMTFPLLQTPLTITPSFSTPFFASTPSAP